MERVYVETSVIGHVAGRLHRDSLLAARQQFARRWWPLFCSKYRVFISELVVDECSAGDSSAAQERLNVIKTLETLDIDDVRGLAAALLAAHAIPPSEPRDAFHVALAAVNGLEYLVTWNFAHIANAAMRAQIEGVCRDAGFEPPVICTPEELAGEDANEISDG